MKLALVLLLTICSQRITFVGDSISVDPRFTSYTSYAAFSGARTWDILAKDRLPFDPCGGKTPLGCEYDTVYPDVALIMIGTNDPYEWQETWFTQNNVKEIVQATLDRGISPVLYTIPDNRNKEVNIYNNFLREYSDLEAVSLIDYNLAMSALPNKGLSEDGVHPSDEGYALRVKLTEDKLREILRCSYSLIAQR